MRFADPAVLAPAVKTLAPGQTWDLHYAVLLSRTAWTPERPRAATTAWR
jgi:hypothetical protein